MQKLIKGYLPTNKKSPTIQFKDTDGLPLSAVESLPEYAGLLAANVVLVDVDDYEESEKLMDIVEDLQLNCRVVQTTRGKHFYFYGGSIDKCGQYKRKKRWQLAIGIEADIKIGDHNSYACLKFDGVMREVIYDIDPDEEYEPVPEWLRPVRSNTEFSTLEAGEGRNQELFNYILTLQGAGLANEDIKETIRLINKYILPDALEDKELNKIIRDEAFKKVSFFDDNGHFKHNKLGKYLISNDHVIMMDKQPHIYENGIYKPGKNYIERKIVELVDTIKINQSREVMAYVKNKAPIVTETADAKYIAFNNGIFNIETKQLEDFRPDLVLINKIPHDYNPDAYNETLDRMLDRVCCNDDNIRQLIEEMAGYCMYRRNELRKAFILIGDKANGKSTLLDVLTEMIGVENTSALDIKEFSDKFRFRTAELYGKLMNAGDDIGDEFINDSSIFKKVVSGDRITVEHKGEKPFSFVNYAKSIFCANNIPRIKDKTGAVIDRLIIIPFNATFSRNDSDYDPYIKYKLREESVSEYLIQLGLRGLYRVLDNNGFTICQKVQDEIDAYNEENNPVIGFINELDIEVDIINQPVADVYIQYKTYCNVNGFTAISKIAFSKTLKKYYQIESWSTTRNGKRIKEYRRAKK